MTEPQISPLARRLAEENSIDWRVIPGTGPESRVIERDILTYLARIMSGEIDPPALPDASEPPAPGGAAPDLSEVSNLAAASAGMAKEGIDLSSLLGGAAPVAAGLATPMFAAPEPVIPAPVIPAPVISEPSHTDLRAPVDEPSLPSLDFAFSNEPTAPLETSRTTSLEQISFGDPIPTAFEAPNEAGESVANEPVFSGPPTKLSPSDSTDAEFEIDLDDFDDVPAALEVRAPASDAAEIVAPVFAAPEFTATDSGASEYSFATASGSTVGDGQLSPLESPDLSFEQAGFGGHQADLVLDVDSTSEAPLTIAALEVSSEIDDALVMTDSSFDDEISPVLETNSPIQAFNLEPVAFEASSVQSVDAEFDALQLAALQPEPAQPEPVQLEPVALESAQLEPASFTASIAPIQHDDFELDLIDTDEIDAAEIDAAELSVTPAIPALESTEPSLAPLEPTVIAGGAAAAALAGGLLTSTPPLESADSSAAAPQNQAISHVVQPVSALDAPQHSPATTSDLTSSSVASGFFQGFAVRRHFDASALTKMQHELTLALNGREVPLAVFLARAAQRNLHALGTGDVVTLTRLADRLEPLQASGLHHSFIEAVQSVARATPGILEGLLILDASSLGADDLVLPGAEPVLTLNVKGEYGHLALSGDLPMGKASEFLGKVALALETPVSLVI